MCPEFVTGVRFEVGAPIPKWPGQKLVGPAGARPPARVVARPGDTGHVGVPLKEDTDMDGRPPRQSPYRGRSGEETRPVMSQQEAMAALQVTVTVTVDQLLTVPPLTSR